MIENDVKSLIEMIDVMKKATDNDKEIHYEDYIDTKTFIDCFNNVGNDVKYYKEELNIFI